ncbi:MAG: hypothetical protein OEQ47_12265, partial [Acidimicrobiia bacterium]|nr:hypothetical protein [Acidimicrobiia bacterium]
PAISLADSGWVAASIATIIAAWYSSSGAAIIGVIAAIVATFAITQTRLLRNPSGHVAPVPDLTAPRERSR